MSQNPPRSVVRYILSTERWKHAELLVLVLGSIGLSLVPVHLLRIFVDEVIPRRETERLGVLAGILVASALVRVGVEYRRTVVGEGLRQAVITRLRSELHGHLLRLSPSFFASRSVGDLMNRVQNETGRLGMSVGWIFLDPLVEGATALLFSGYLLLLDPRLFVLALAATPVALLVAPRINARLGETSRIFTARMGAYGARLQESLSSVGEIQAHGTWALESARVDHAQRQVVDAWMRVTRLTAALSAASDLTRGLGPVLVYAVGGLLAVRGGLPVGRIVAFGGLLGGLYAALDKLLKYPPQLRVAEDRYTELLALLDTPATFLDPPGAAASPGPSGAVSLALERVTFLHDADHPVVDELDLTIEAGEHVVIVGPSGSGKSTALGLLGGRLRPARGVVKVGGVDLWSMPLARRSDLLGIASQHAVIFSGTLRENLLYALLRRSADSSTPLAWVDREATEAPLDDEGLVALCCEVGLGEDLVEIGLQCSCSGDEGARYEPVRASMGTPPSPWDPTRPLRENLLPAGWDEGDAAEDAAVLARLRACLEEQGLAGAVRRLAMDRDVGERGARLSGGQRQKIALARVLLKRPAVLLLDEVTASLDEASSRRVVGLVRGRLRGVTVVAVTHDLKITEAYDRIVVMERGRVVEVGTREKLLEREGLFARLAGSSPGITEAAAGGDQR
jgi:ABC-type multidrug transport system fused ATPase/permease subunit